MNVTYKMKAETDNKTILDVSSCGMLAAHSESLYIRLSNGIESFIPLSGLDWYSVKAVNENEC